MNLYYVLPDGEKVLASTIRPDSHGYTEWLHRMVDTNPDTIFFFTVESTDIWEDEIDFNTVVSHAGDGSIYHTYNPDCPHDCTGQMEGCVYRRENDG